MADKKNGNNFVERAGTEAPAAEQLAPKDSGLEKTGENFESASKPDAADRAEQIIRNLVKPDKQDDLPVEIGSRDIEEKKELLVSKLVEAALAAGDDEEAARAVFDRAGKYLSKYPGIVDEIHDRWLGERNKGM